MTAKKPNPKHYEVAYIKAEENYRDTGDVRYIILAIGAYPDKAPDWVVGACREYFLEAQRRNFSGLYTRPGPQRNPKDYELLEQMIDLLASGQVETPDEAAAIVTGEERDGANNTRLRRLYKQESFSNADGEQEPPKRLDRAVAQRVTSGDWDKKE